MQSRVAVAFLVPKQTKLVDAAGRITWVNPNIYPYMWKVVEASARGTEDCQGAFEDACILDIFALYLENVHNLPKEFRHQSMPKGALAIATAAVERVWKMWSMGTYVKPKRAAHSQFAEGLWNDHTALVMESLNKASCRKWKC
ncbi:uncharacterized protein F5891DRAFT_1186851 [Suillus fuscotomentosus]|uniref:Uncharacterized protein n=1 Tax=Suillus fuscotomentosus TaxID=1912939 RepID=A0AAD4EC81_9AGAM|nr:uncharacterized protein F5891DRAFT_1186851 [Suillus fuscotomentosus]KAG1902268.1 hypothetical protein F5891DRAFT_1186851 [Suillus fuscotomentosus]